MIRLKSIINVALRDGVLQHNPYDGVSIAAYKSRKDFLSYGELQLLLKELPTLAPEPYEAIRRFCFCCCTGLRFGDADKLDYSMLRQTDKGYYFVFEQNKTSDTVLVPLNSIALTLIDTTQKTGLVFKTLTNQHLNRYTKKICAKLGIARNITTHVARHTFVTVSQELGMDRNMAGAIAGHKNPKTTAGYSHYNLNSLFDAIAKWN